VPRLLELLASAERPYARLRAASALGTIGHPRAVAGLTAALKDDGCPSWGRHEVWESAQRALEQITRCRLSPNGDKARRWWDVAQHLEPVAWERVGIAEVIESLLILGPSAQRQAEGRLGRFAAPQRVRPGRFGFMDRDEYDPKGLQRDWRQWLTTRGWPEYEGLPSQVDDELTLRAEATASLDSGEAVRMRYLLTNASDEDLWLCRHHKELIAMRSVRGGGSFNGHEDFGPAQLSEKDFFLLHSGEQRPLAGRFVICNHPTVTHQPRPSVVAAGLRFQRKGTSVGHDAWVGEVWAEPVVLSPIEGTG